jgi:hypothetical protein
MDRTVGGAYGYRRPFPVPTIAVVTRLLPRMPVEPPPAYVAFVERHLEPLRRDALRIVDDDDDADEVSGAVLTDVAIRWRWFELLRVGLGRRDPAGAYLPLAFARRSAQWKSEAPEVEVEVWGADEPPDPPAPGPAPHEPRSAQARGADARDLGTRGARARGPRASGTRASVTVSAAARIAQVRPPPLAHVSALGEAAVAWWHAYEAHVRRRRIAAATVVFAFVAILVRLHNDLAVD